MLGAGGGPLEYKPRKKKKDPNIPSFSQMIGSRISNFLGFKSKPVDLNKKVKKSKFEIEKEHMDLHWSNFDYELENQSAFEMPPRIVYEEEGETAKAASASCESCEYFFDLVVMKKHCHAILNCNSDPITVGVQKSESEIRLASSEQQILGQSIQKLRLNNSNDSISKASQERKASPLRREVDSTTTSTRLRMDADPAINPNVPTIIASTEDEVLHCLKDKSIEEKTWPSTQVKNGTESLSQ